MRRLPYCSSINRSHVRPLFGKETTNKVGFFHIFHSRRLMRRIGTLIFQYERIMSSAIDYTTQRMNFPYDSDRIFVLSIDSAVLCNHLDRDSPDGSPQLPTTVAQRALDHESGAEPRSPVLAMSRPRVTHFGMSALRRLADISVPALDPNSWRVRQTLVFGTGSLAPVSTPGRSRTARARHSTRLA